MLDLVLHFEHDDMFDRFALRTADPRVVAIAERYDHAEAPEWDTLAPAAWADAHAAFDPRAGGFADPDLALIHRAYERALWAFGRFAGRRFEMAARYLRIFYGVHEVRTVWGQHDGVRIYDTPNHREHVGLGEQPERWEVNGVTAPGRNHVCATFTATREVAEARFRAIFPGHHITVTCRATHLDGDAEVWKAYLDGETYAVGALVNPEHTLWGPDEATPLEEDGEWELHDGFMVHGHLGHRWAAEAAVEAAEDAVASLPELLPWDVLPQRATL